ncbi:MAG: hypothetical protein NXI31_26680 [bacterium]|nr:hypothetical protein [bacterium]
MKPIGRVQRALRGALVAAATAAIATAQDPLDGLEGLGDLEGLDEPATQAADSGVGLRVTGIRGFLESRGRFFTRDRRRGDGRSDAQWVQELEVEFDLAITREISGYFRPRFLIDALDDDLIRTDPLEAYATWDNGVMDFRAGQFVENWGIADTFNPIDVLNRRDLGEDPVDPQRLGELGVRWRWRLPGGDTIAEPIVSVYAIPVLQQAQFPNAENRFSLATGNDRLREDLAGRPGGIDRWFFAVRTQNVLNTPIANADVQLLAARGPDRFPLFNAAPNALGGVDLTPTYFGIWTVGGGFRAVPNVDALADYTLKTEVVYKVPYRIDGSPAALPDEYLQYAFGFDRLFPNVFTDKDQITFTAEWVGETGANDSTSLYRPFDDDLVLRGFWEANDFDRTSVELRAIFDGGGEEWIAEGILQRQLRMIHEDLQFELGLRWFEIDRSEPGFFALFPNNSNVWVAIRLDF